MTFVQFIDCKTSNVDRLNQLMDSWVEATEGKRTATHSIVGRDRSDSTHLVEIVEFPSYEEAMKNSNLPETDRIFQELIAACDEMPTFTDLDVVRDVQLNKDVVHRFVDEVMNAKNFELANELCTDNYREHDPALSSYDLDFAQAIRESREIMDAFNPRLTLESMIAEGDLVTCRITFQGRHTGTYQGLEPTDRNIAGTGHATFRCQGGKIAESWWNWDNFGLLRQVGALD
ncbi:ester cyclase [Streptomyces sp. 8N114]|uniref:ester cyclase n=1 Tax=Streptomyces sp. 8N114 TaxID=3457419 RepID=UPI003FD422DA